MCKNWQHRHSRKLPFADEALEAGAKVAICSTSNEKAVQMIVDVMMEPEVASQIRVLLGM